MQDGEISIDSTTCVSEVMRNAFAWLQMLLWCHPQSQDGPVHRACNAENTMYSLKGEFCQYTRADGPFVPGNVLPEEKSRGS